MDTTHTSNSAGHAINHVAGILSTDADSGRASMASNIDQEQYSPIFQRKF